MNKRINNITESSVDIYDPTRENAALHFSHSFSGLVLSCQNEARIVDGETIDAMQRVLLCFSTNKSFSALSDKHPGVYPGKTMDWYRGINDIVPVVIINVVDGYSLVVDESLWGTKFSLDYLSWVPNEHLHVKPDAPVPATDEVISEITKHIGAGIHEEYMTVLAGDKHVVYHKPSGSRFAVSVREIK